MAVSWLDVKHQCKDVTRLVSLAQDVRLPWHRRLKVRLHLSICSACAAVPRTICSVYCCMSKVVSRPNFFL